MLRGKRTGAWAVILAGGDGRRLRSLTTALYGVEVPKQFVAFGGRLSLLQETLGRLSPVFSEDRMIVVVTGSQEKIARHQLASFPAVEIAVQPRNLDTGPGILFPLARILAIDPEAQVAFFPSDHHIPRPDPFLEAVEQALSSGAPGRITVLGAAADSPETEYGWIIPGRMLEPDHTPALREVYAFVEKPPLPLAERLLASGGLWNIFVFTADARTIWEHVETCLPDHARRFADLAGWAGSRSEPALLRAVYSRMRPANFSREVLERIYGLAVLTVEDSGWSDWGSPARVFRAIEESSRSSVSPHRKVESMPTRILAKSPRLEWESRYKRFTPSKWEIKHIERGIATLARRVEVFPKKHLHVDVRGLPRRSRFELTVTLELPNRQLVVGDTGDRASFPTAWGRCVKKLEHKLDAYLVRLSGRENLRAVAERKLRSSLSAAAGRELEKLWEKGDFAGFTEAVEDLRGELLGHVRRVQSSRPAPRLLEDEVVEAVHVLAFDGFGSRPHGVSFSEWIQGLVPRALHDLRAKRGHLLERSRHLRSVSSSGSATP